jgi:hypothetical protein
VLYTGWSHTETPRALLMGKLEVLHEERPKVLPLEQTKKFFRMEPHQETCSSQDKKWTNNQLRLRKKLTT